jgi:hypothetical protein
MTPGRNDALPVAGRDPRPLPGDLEGVRLYNLEGEKALRLTYQMASGDYWGIQQAAWTDAPVLNGPTLTRTIKGREYKLYFSGSKLHMVAFEENDSA